MKNKYTFKKKKSFPVIFNIFNHIKLKHNKLVITSICLTKFYNISNPTLDKLYVMINNKSYKLEFMFKKGIPYKARLFFNIYKIKINLEDILEFDIQNKIILMYDDYKGKMFYRYKDYMEGQYRHSNIIKYDNMAFYMRQSINNTSYLSVREIGYYDKFINNLKILLAFLISKLIIKKDFILLFEKKCSKYEESASVLYERLIDKKYDNVYFILNKDNIKMAEINDKYKKNIIVKNSFKHLVYFFKCKKFISSEVLNHVIELRTTNRLVNKKINDKSLTCVFLQHGVMYMISLNSEARSSFRKSNYKVYRIIVSSNLEKNHFVDLANFDEKNLYVCGLPKFDKSYRYADADKIVIMPTWRRWEINQASKDYKETDYYKMIERIISAIPKSLQDKIVILPHPLMLDVIKKNEEIGKNIPENIVYDEILRTCSLLITDYSSIAYDAFYRGCNVIFYWEELNDCLKKYGKNTSLMMKENVAIGDIVYDKKSLSNIIKDNYLTPQKKKYINRYRKIVEFNDNKNTDRLIQMLKKDKII